MIIFGSKGKESIVGSGTFTCPGCGNGKPYLHKKLQRYFTLYFIPIFPVATLGEHVECGSCHGLWKTEVLTVPPPAVS